MTRFYPGAGRLLTWRSFALLGWLIVAGFGSAMGYAIIQAAKVPVFLDSPCAMGKR